MHLGLVGQDMETLVTRPRVPSEPMKRCLRSYPVLSFFMLWKESDSVGLKRKQRWKKNMKRIQTLKDSRQSLQMQALLQHQEPSHAGFHTCIRFFVYGHPIQGSRFSFGAFRIFFFTWASATLLHWCSHCPRCGSYPEKIMYGFNFLFVFYLVSGCSFINIGAHKYLCPQVKRDHHPLVCQGGVKCFKDHPRLNLEFKFQPETLFGNSISGIYLTDCHSSTWVNAFNVGHQPGWYHHLVIAIIHWYEPFFLPNWPRQTLEHCHPPDLCCRPDNKAKVFRVKK